MSETDLFLSKEEVTNLRKPRMSNQEKNIENKANRIRIEYSSSGRFWIPSELNFRELNTKEIADLSASSIDNLLENLIAILNDCILEDINVEDMTPEEFLETLIALKLEYTVEHDHFFICESCSVDDIDFNEVKPSKFQLDLTTLNYVDIEEADKKLKEYYEPILRDFSKEEWESYIIQRHKDNPIENVDSWTVEKELETIEVRKEYSLPYEGKKYSFRWLKISDIVYAQRETDKKHKPKIKKIIKEKYANVPMTEQKAIKKEKIDKIREEQNKDVAYYTIAMSLEKIDGVELSINEKLTNYVLPQSVANSIGQYLKSCEFGLIDERDIICDKCGHEQRRWLQHTITFVELLPINNATKRRSATTKRNIVLIGV